MPPKNDALIAAALVGLTANASAATTFIEMGDIDGTNISSSTFSRVEGGLSGFADSRDNFNLTGLTPGATIDLDVAMLSESSASVSLRFEVANSSSLPLGNVNVPDVGTETLSGITVPSDGILRITVTDGNGAISESGESGSYAVTVPEAGSAAMVGLAGLAAINRRRRRK